MGRKERTNGRRGGFGGEAARVPDVRGPVGRLLVDLDERDELGVDPRVPERLGAGERVVEVQPAREGELMVFCHFCLRERR